jgi:hypothetical protein
VDLLVAWVAFPLVLSALAVGCGLLVDALTGRRLRFALIPLAGLALVIVVGEFLTLADATAELTTPVCVGLAAVGFAVGLRRLRPRSGWPLAAAAVVFAIYAAPIVASGEATFAGYIKLDDTATWMALTDRVMEHGRDLSGLAPSSYEATLSFNLADGYPIGVFLPLGVGSKLAGADVAWLIQPYMAWLAALLALGLWALARPLLASARLCALVAAIGAQSALLFGYYLWGGIKELAAAALIAGFAASAGDVVRRGFEPRSLVLPALIAAALVGVLTAAGLVWLAPVLVALLVLAVRGLAPPAVVLRAVGLAAGIAVLSIPVLATGLRPPTSSPLDDPGARGNLIAPLDPAQIAGIWPAGDFRLDAVDGWLTGVLVAAALLLAAAALVVAWRRRSWGALSYVAGTLVAAAAIYAYGSPWVDGKALATASPAIPFAAALGGALAFASGRRAIGAIAIAALAIGVVWSNALAYRDVSLAPRDQLAELERIGELIDGQGPTLMTEYQPYGVRHFLRDADPEGVSELRRHLVPLAEGGTVAKGETADTDALDPAGLELYRTLVLRRTPFQSRPPAAYRLRWRGDYYEVWQRPADAVTAAPRIALGGEVQPVGRPNCSEVRALAATASPDQRLIAAARAPVIVAPLSGASYPASWRDPGSPGDPTPRDAGELETSVEIQRAGAYELWLGGSVRPEATVSVDGHPAGEVRAQLENQGEYVRLGAARLGPGPHAVGIEFAGPDLHPGSGGVAGPIGPLVLSSADAADVRLVAIDPGDARQLCGRRWDWVELGGPVS